MEKHLNFKTSASAQPIDIEQRSHSGKEDKDFLNDFRGVIRDFNKLSSWAKTMSVTCTQIVV